MTLSNSMSITPSSPPRPRGKGSNMGQFSVEKPVAPGSVLSGNQQGQTDYDGRISRCGDEMVRTALYQAANVLLHHGRWSSLRSWAMRIAKRGSVKGSKVALARRLAVVMHRMWTDGTDFRWSDTSRMTAPTAA